MTPIAVSRGARLVTQHPHLMANYGRLEMNIVRGDGCWLFDESGNRYLDLVAGIAVCALGHAHPRIARAIAEQAATLVHVSNLVHHEPAGTLADRLAELSGFDAVFFCNSGTEANEAAIKLARKHAWRRGEKNRNVVLAARGSFHGRTMGALAATDNPAYHEGFEPLPRGFEHVPYNDVAALEAAIGETTAAFLVEPVQGESGVVPATQEYLDTARRMCDEHGALLIFDEVQCGMGRLGTLFAFQQYGVRPDAFTLAKSLANGLPIGALVVRGEAASSLKPGDHGTTFGGSPVPAAAALEHLAIRDVVDLDQHVTTVGALLRAELTAVATELPAVFEAPRGGGLMLGLPVREPHVAKEFVARGLDHGVLLNAAGRNTLRFVPPLVISADEVRDAAQRLRATIAAVLAG
ncbi:MAG TPA: aspartate aminotransferase family protein [Candidatus Elarobacter sp.]|jgi:predicted acetylornithine/succinylornithine family transaminase